MQGYTWTTLFLLIKHSNRISAHRSLLSEETAVEKKGLCLFTCVITREKKPLSTDIGLEIKLDFPSLLEHY